MATQLLLLEDVDNLGRKGDVVGARPGYAYNYLIPQGFAMIATAGSLRRQTKLQEERRKIADQDRKEAEAHAEGVNGQTISFTVKVDREGHMYGSVTSHDIVDLLKAQTGIDLDKRFVQLKHPIKQTGVFDVTLRFKEGVTCTVHVKVIPEHSLEG